MISALTFSKFPALVYTAPALTNHRFAKSNRDICYVNCSAAHYDLTTIPKEKVQIAAVQIIK
jgi:hypothetical protein